MNKKMLVTGEEFMSELSTLSPGASATSSHMNFDTSIAMDNMMKIWKKFIEMTNNKDFGSLPHPHVQEDFLKEEDFEL